jgi:hypothetical protein
MPKLKNILTALILLAICSYATWKGMQTLSIVTIILFIGALNIKKVNMLFDLFFSLARHARQAKFGNLEVNIGDSFKQAVLDNLNPDKEWVKAIISDLTPTHLTILLAINKAGKYHCSNHVKNSLRDLRAKGLIVHNKGTLEESDIVWLTEIGCELVNEISS